MSNHYFFTTVTSRFHSLNKSFDAQGNKTSNAILLHGNFNVSYVDNIPQLFEKFKLLNSYEAIMQSIPKNNRQQGEIIAEKYNDNTGYYLTRTQKDFEYCGNHILCFDYDPDENGYKIDTPQQFVEVVCDIDPKLKNCQIGVTFGSSYGIYVDEKPLSNKKSFHMYIFISNATNEKVKQYIDYLFNEACKKGYSHIKISKSGSLLERTCFDQAPTSPESLLFEAKPTLASNITQNKPNDYFYNIEGGDRDLNDIDYNDNESERIFQKMKEEIEPKAKKIKEQYINLEAELLATKKNISIESAIKVIKNKVEDSILSPDTILVSKDKGEITVSDILSNPAQYNKLQVLDPLGTNQNEFCAMIFINDNSMIVHSFKHGGKNYYIKPDIDFIKHKCHEYKKTDELTDKNFVKSIKKYCDQLDLLNYQRHEISNILLSKKIIFNINELNLQINFPDFTLNKDHSKNLLSTMDNCEKFIKSYGIQISYDEILKEPLIKIPNFKDETDDSINSKFAYLKSEITKYGLNKRIIDDFLPALVDKYSINPLMDMVKSKEWDNVDRLSNLVDCISSTDDVLYVKYLITIWLLQCVAAWDSCTETPIPFAKQRF